ncbi:hypothetical protein U728_755 [Clostridium botulinum 202F]|nr:hypothetical protein U728_755 [Clostridium botulinum 202F]KON14718.1 hypothetical protein ACP50_00785 [Clostridium botulinum]MBY6988455.1 hypothetical protein [Clostridium botulinum]NFH01692.1 hypothetical protein [Clostridium botulinum]NFP41030.1 hypothetical protein [Clostridium botulinum]
MNWSFQRKQVKPTAKCCDWCKYLYKCHEIVFGEDIEVEKCVFENTQKYPRMTHRLNLKLMKEQDFRYCKNYRYSKEKFKDYKKMCKENAKVTGFDFDL